MLRVRRCDVASPRDPHANTSEGGDVSVHGAVELRRANYRWAPDTATPTSPCRIGESSTGNECDNDVGGVAVEVLSAPVVDGGCAGVGMAGGELHVTQGDTGVEGGHDERATSMWGWTCPRPARQPIDLTRNPFRPSRTAKAAC